MNRIGNLHDKVYLNTEVEFRRREFVKRTFSVKTSDPNTNQASLDEIVNVGDGVFTANDYQKDEYKEDVISVTRDKNRICTLPSSPDLSIESQLRNTIVVREPYISPIEDCKPSVQFHIDTYNETHWILYTLDKNGIQKKKGGDEFYITYTDNITLKNEKEVPPHAVAFIYDQENGSYLLSFSTTPMNPSPEKLSGTGRLTIHLEYTCGIGMIPQPEKYHWKDSGATVRTFTHDSIRIPHFTTFHSPKLPNLSSWPLVIFFGDSTMLQMIKDQRKMNELGVPQDQHLFMKNNTYFQANIRTEFRMDRVKHIGTMFQRMHRKQLLKYESNVAVILGSAIWDVLIVDNVQGRNFTNHLEACRTFVEKTRGAYRRRQFYWRSPSALHMHRVNCSEALYEYEACVNSTRYLSQSRVRFLHEQQKALMNELNMEYLDLYDVYYLSAYYTGEGDGRHYRQELNELILDWFYPSNETSVQ